MSSRYERIMPRSRAPVTGTLGAALALLSSVALADPGDRTEPLPRSLAGVGVTERLGAQVPTGIQFRTSEGQDVTLGELLPGDRPVLLTLNYSECPLLCNLQLSGLVEAMNAIEWTAGKEFNLLTVSLDPHETLARSRATKDRYLKAYREETDGWEFVTGEEASIRALADNIGFGYRYLEDEGEYAHAAVVVVLTPPGRVSRYLHGVAYSPQTLRLSMAEASEGKQVSTLDSFVLFCFKYDADAGTYTPVIANLMKLGGGLTVLALALFIGTGIARKRILRPRSRPENGVQSDVVAI